MWADIVTSLRSLSPEHQINMALIWSVWMIFLFGKSASEALKSNHPITGKMVYGVFAIISWLHIFLHEVSHLIVALLSLREIKRFHVGIEEGEVVSYGDNLTRSYSALAPFIWWALAPFVAHWLATADAPFWQTSLASFFLPILVAGGYPSQTDYKVMRYDGKIVFIGIYGLLFVWVPYQYFFNNN